MRLLILGFCILYFFQVHCGKYDQAIKTTVDYIEQVRRDSHVPGIAAGVAINGSVVWVNGFGETDIDNEVKTRADSVWRLASISKSITSALIGRLIDDGLISLNNSIHDYLPLHVFPRKTWNNKPVDITLGQVMSHTAGLYVMKLPDDLLKKFDFANVTDTLQLFKDEPLQFAPGTHWNYSNYGFQVVGAVIECVLNRTYESVMNEMFAELGMTSTQCERRQTVIPHRVRYYTTDPDNSSRILNTHIFPDLVSLEAMWPAGGLVSTVPDLLKYGSHMISWYRGGTDDNKFNLNKKTVADLWNPIMEMDSPDLIRLNLTDKYEYAHGWMVVELKTPIECTVCAVSPIKRLYGHEGGMEGVTTLYMNEPGNQISVAIFTNKPIAAKIFSMVIDIMKNFLQ